MVQPNIKDINQLSCTIKDILMNTKKDSEQILCNQIINLLEKKKKSIKKEIITNERS